MPEVKTMLVESFVGPRTLSWSELVLNNLSKATEECEVVVVRMTSLKYPQLSLADEVEVVRCLGSRYEQSQVADH
jgi:hypothetical protein